MAVMKAKQKEQPLVAMTADKRVGWKVGTMAVEMALNLVERMVADLDKRLVVRTVVWMVVQWVFEMVGQ
jgi:hypothetical protein